MKWFLRSIQSRTRSPLLSRRRGNTTASAAGPSSWSSSPVSPHPETEGAQEDPALTAAMVASLEDNHPRYPTQLAAGYASDDDAAAMAAAVAASLDKQEGNQPTTSPPSHSPTESQRPYPGSHTSQDLAFLTDKPLLPPDSFYGSDGAASSTGRETPAGTMRRNSEGASSRNYSGHERSHTEEDETLARRLQAQWISEDSAGAGVGSGAGGGSQQRLGEVMTGAFGRQGANVCVVCGMPITERTFHLGEAGCLHLSCAPLEYSPLPPCKVCNDRLPSEDGRIHFYRHNYFNDVYCPWHHDSAARCYSCMRLEPMLRPGGEGCFAELQDGRLLCMPCAQTAVVDSAEGAPAFQDVCRFFEQELELNVPLEMREVPVLLVDSPTLNEQTHRDSSHGGGVEQGIPTTRGLTLSEVATVRHMASGAMQFNAATNRFEVGPPAQVDLGERRAVTAILVLCGLPYASFTSILAHESMHAWMKLDPSFPSQLPAQVEEGVCQLIALLWLEHLAGGGVGGESTRRDRNHGENIPTEEDLRGFFAHQIKTDISEVYGDGFRKAKKAYDAVGLHTLLTHVKRHKIFPIV